MSDSYHDHQGNGRNFPGQRDGGRNTFRGGRNSGNRDNGGFRIRLSDNEMRAARSLQETFNLRSTIAVLGFALRTLAQMLEEGKLEEFVKEYKSQAPYKESKQNQYSRRNRYDNESQKESGSKANPFARPEKPQPNTVEEQSNSVEEEHQSTDRQEQNSNEETIISGEKDSSTSDS